MLNLDRLRGEHADFDSLASHLFLSMFSNSPIGVYVVGDGVFSLTNLYFQEGTGYAHGELIGKEPLFLVVHGDKEKVRRDATAMLRGRRKAPYKFRIRTRSGDIRWIVGSIGFFYYGGKRAAIGYYMEPLGRWLLALMGHGEGQEAFEAWYAQWGLWVILIKGLTPIPYKLVTIASGLAQFSLFTFIWASVITRGARFFLTAALLKHFGPAMRAEIERRLLLYTTIGVVLLVGAIVLVKVVL